MPHRPARDPRRQQIAARPILFDGGLNLLDPAQVRANEHVAGRNWFRGEDMVIRPRPGNLPWDQISGVNPIPPSIPPAPPPTFAADAVLSIKDTGIFVTADSGETYTNALGVTSANETDLWWDGPTTVWATQQSSGVNPRKLRKSTDKGLNFAAFGNDVHAVRLPLSVTVIPSTGRIVVGLSTEVAPNDELAIAYSDDQATSWTTVIVATTPLLSDIRLYSVTWVSGTTVMFLARKNDAVAREQLYRSTNGGVTWAKVGPLVTSPMLFIWKDPNTGSLFSTTEEVGIELYRSTDQGATWTLVHTVTITGFNNVPARSQIARWSDGRLIWHPPNTPASGRQSADDGLTWTVYTAPDPKTAGLYRMRDAMIASRSIGGTDGWRSTDGTNWVLLAGKFGNMSGFASLISG